ncbi:MAG: 23S rRNA (adenine(2503)-C(2))-methyltransferase RlmN [Candidatus Margulisiibacteriota bacterium]
MEDIRSKSFEEIIEIGNKLGLAPFKARELYRAVHGKGKEKISELTTLQLAERTRLEKKYQIIVPKALQVKKGNRTIKAAFELVDGKIVEAVMMDYEEERKTVCLSSQVGCPIGCLFCATGRGGFRRNLTPGEIVSQVYFFAKMHQITNLVFMGMGEPFLNYHNVMIAAKNLNNDLGLNIAARKIVLSTIGIPAGINQLAREPGQYRLAWSLVSPFDHDRRQLVPYRSLPSIATVVEAIGDYQSRTNRRVTIEYVVLRGVNDRMKDIKEIIAISRHLDCHINLIPYNVTVAGKFETGNIEKMYAELRNVHLKVTVRQSLGGDVNGACGQLAAKLR